MKNRVLFLVVVASLVFPGVILGESMSSQYKPNLQRDFCQAAQRASDFLVMAQIPARDGAVGWNWVLGDGTRPDNIAGLAALSLLDAYAATGSEKPLAAAKRYADYLVARQDRFSVRDLPYKADVELLARLGGMPAGEAYAQVAKKLLGVLQTRSPKGTDEVERIAQGRKGEPALLGFDVALGIRAAAAMGDRPYAYALADEVLRRMPAASAKPDRFRLVSAGALAVALERLDAGHYRERIDSLRAELTRSQGANGAWLSNETQPSAYATAGLLASNLPTERRAAVRGLHWLKSTMLRSGGYAHYNDYMPEPFVGQLVSEVNAEVLSALSFACIQGLENN